MLYTPQCTRCDLSPAYLHSHALSQQLHKLEVPSTEQKVDHVNQSGLCLRARTVPEGEGGREVEGGWRERGRRGGGGWCGVETATSCCGPLLDPASVENCSMCLICKL